MSHFAEVDESNTVLRVIVVGDSNTTDEDGVEVDSIGEAYCTDLLGGTWKRTSYNGNYRTRYAGIGYTYDEARDAFISPQPFPSWTLNETTTDWEPPTQSPVYGWDEDTTSWVEITP